jgi:hypothetical protein
MELAKTHTKVCYNQSYGVPSSHYGFLKEMPKMCSRGLSLNFFNPWCIHFRCGGNIISVYVCMVDYI